jgi:hypothetical protein
LCSQLQAVVGVLANNNSSRNLPLNPVATTPTAASNPTTAQQGKTMQNFKIYLAPLLTIL